MTDLLVPSVDSALSCELAHGRPLCSPCPKGAPSPMPPVIVLRVTRLQAVGLAIGMALVLAGCLLSVQRCALDCAPP